MTGEFRTLPEYPGYEFHPDGRIRGKSGRWLALHPNTQGYLHFTPTDATGKQRTVPVHIAICRAFQGDKPSPDLTVRHLNSDNRDNRADNLCWGTWMEQYEDRVAAGRQARAGRGERHHNAKLTAEQVQEIRERYAAGGVLQRELAVEYGVTNSRISSLTRGMGWKEGTTA